MKYILPLLLLVPTAFVLEFAHIGGPAAVFAVSALSLIPLAAVLGRATEEAAVVRGPRIGALLHAAPGIQFFDSKRARTNAMLMALAIVSFSIPAVFALGRDEPSPSDENISFLCDGLALTLIVVYAVYMLASLRQQSPGDDLPSKQGAPTMLL